MVIDVMELSGPFAFMNSMDERSSVITRADAMLQCYQVPGQM
jgi:hypothetical protein